MALFWVREKNNIKVMAQQYFVLGIGGTGMRCIESLIHLCAMGMFDDTDIHLLALDTDKDNGNFARLKEVKEAYVKTKGTEASQRTALMIPFFLLIYITMSSRPTMKLKVILNQSSIMAIQNLIILSKQQLQI